MYGQGGQAPSIQIQYFVQRAFSLAIFLSILCVKTGKVEVNRY